MGAFFLTTLTQGVYSSPFSILSSEEDSYYCLSCLSELDHSNCFSWQQRIHMQACGGHGARLIKISFSLFLKNEN